MDMTDLLSVPGFHILDIDSQPDQITILAHVEAPSSCCPDCHLYWLI